MKVEDWVQLYRWIRRPIIMPNTQIVYETTNLYCEACGDYIGTGWDLAYHASELHQVSLLARSLIQVDGTFWWKKHA